MFQRGKQAQQKTIFDPDQTLSKMMKKMLENSWAGSFFETVFLAIQEDRFRVLYSENKSRPNSPVNMLVSLLLLKELNHLTDEELIESLAFDYRFHYALGIEDIEKERICINTLTNFRKRLVEYEIKTGKDLLKEEFEHINEQLAKNIGISYRMARMDSMMISSSCKVLTRLELVYTVIKNMVRTMNTLGEPIPELFSIYLEANHKKSQLYQAKTEEAQTKTEFLFQQANELYLSIAETESLKQTPAYIHLARLLKEQCVMTEDGTCVPIKGKDVLATSLQNPSDPDATFRSKGNEKYVGYVANVVEVRDEEKKVSLIMNHEIEPNVHSDAQFGEDFVTNQDLAIEIDTLVADGAYYRTETFEKAQQKNLAFSTSTMTGGNIPLDRVKVSDFTIDETTRKVESCPSGHSPIYAEYQEDKKVYRAKFLKPDCEQCPLLNDCPIEIKKEFNTLRFTEKKLQADRTRAAMTTDEHRKLADFRAGVEGIPSVLRRVYRIDNIPSRGFVRLKIWVNCKIAAYNLKQFVRYTSFSAIYDYFYSLGIIRKLGRLHFA